MIRSPIIVTVGHSDHGKTTLLDKIRGTAVTKQEPGQLTQHVGASYIPQSTIRRIAGQLLEKFKIELAVPGLLFIDTPGHKAFLGMRKRGGAISDLAVLVVDITEGFQEQTDESLKILKEFKTPFVVAATKLDKIRGWFPNKNLNFLESFSKQRDDVKNELDTAVYKIVSQLTERGFDSDRFDRISNFAKQIAVVPVSGSTGEGIPELLMMLAGLSQQFLKERLKLSNIAKGNVLEVKEMRGVGTTIDAILYDGEVSQGDIIVIGGRNPTVGKIKALLVPRMMQEIRTERQFEKVGRVSAASGVKIVATNVENVVAGSSIIFVKSEKEVESAKKLLQKEVEEVEFEKKVEGVTLKADTLGSLEALVKILSEEDIPIRKAEIGEATKQDLSELQNVKDKFNRVLLTFNVKVPTETKHAASDLGVKVFSNDVIYRLIEDFKNWIGEEKEKELKEKLESVMRPAEIKVLKGTVFRQSDPAVFGVEVLRGTLKAGALMKRGAKTVDKVKEIQKEGRAIPEAKKGDKVAVSMENVTVGKHVNEGDVLTVAISDNTKKILKDIWEKLSEDEKSLLG